MSRKPAFSDLEGKDFKTVAAQAAKEESLIFHGTHFDPSAGRRVEEPISDDVRHRHALAFELDERQYGQLKEGLLESLEGDALDRLPNETKQRIRSALKARHEYVDDRGARVVPNNIPMFTAVDDIKTGTTVFDGGNFYEGEIHLPGEKVPIRVKKYGDPKKFKRGIPFQRFLKRLETDRILRDKDGNTIRINSPAYIDEYSGLVAELHLEGRRLTDILRDAPNDQTRADILRPVIGDYMEISLKATEMKDLKVDEKDARRIGREFNRHQHLEDITDEGHYYLRRNGGVLTGLKNIVSGNYIIPSQGNPKDNFFKVFALRAIPYFRNKYLTPSGKVREEAFHQLGTQGSIMSHIRDALGSIANPDFKRRKKFIVNLDANPTQVMVAGDGRRTYTDWDHTYFGLLEEQLAEILLGSGISDESVLEGLVNETFHQVGGEIGGTLEDWRRIVDKKLVEKLLARSARFVDVASGIEDTKEKKELRDLANEAYTLALRKLDGLAEKENVLRRKTSHLGGLITNEDPISGLPDAKKSIKRFAESQLGLREVEEISKLRHQSGNIGSIVSTVHNRTSLEGMKSDYRISSRDPEIWRKIGVAAGLTGLLAAGLAGVVTIGMRTNSMNKIEEMKIAAKYSGRDMTILDPHYKHVEFEFSDKPGTVALPDHPQTEDDWIRWAYEVSPENSEGDDFVHNLQYREIARAKVSAREREQRNKIENTRPSWEIPL
ncbi:MAG: hypothetical protein ABH864_00760 [archaeon]